MPKSRILRDKQNVTVPDTEKGTTNHRKTFKRTKVAGYGGSQPRVQLTQQKRKYDEVEPQPPMFHASIQKNTKVAMQSRTDDMRDRKTDKLNVMTILNASCGNTDAGPIVVFNGPLEAFQMTADALNVLDAVLEKVEKIPVPEHTTGTQQVNRHVSKSLEILSAAIMMNERTATNDNIHEEKKTVTLKTVRETEDTVQNNAVRVGAVIPDAIQILNVAIPKPEEYQSPHNYELITYDQCPEDIMQYMINLEVNLMKPKPGYMSKQPEITGAMRSKLVDWLVHVFQGTNDKILHMTVHYIDTILSRVSFVKSKLPLLACAAGLIACKMEKVYIQNAEHWVILGGETFNKFQLLEMQRIIKSVMKMQLYRPTIVCFIRHICYIGKVHAKITILAHYMSELVLIEGAVYLRYFPSLLASAIVALARHTLGQSDIWPQELIAVTHYTLQQLLPLFALLRISFNNAPKNPNTFVYNKYKNKKLRGVAKLKLKQFNAQ